MGIEQYFRSEALDRYRHALDDPELVGSNFSQGTKIMLWSLLLVVAIFFACVYSLHQRSRKFHYECEGGVVHIQTSAKEVSHVVVIKEGKSAQMLLTEDSNRGGYVASDPPKFLCAQRKGEAQLILN